ncbi:von Willebrand factor A domain-containing protein 7-like [Osmerus eperlanus]|uniref:von Willebrand factor A domain-containing protein 7-like n=1 Tax=Osmerus eperlanus TaxID=29151 RepID=UPI002E0F6679
MMLSPVPLVFLLIPFLQKGALGFKPISLFESDSKNHQQITVAAILETTLQVCRDVAIAEGRDFSSAPRPLTTEGVALACQSSGSESFSSAQSNLKWSNALVDAWKLFSPRYHFDSETFEEGRKLITDGMSVVKKSIDQGNLQAAREKLGEISHTLQDFYSHSNWIELGNTLPHPSLIRSDISIGPVADRSTPTCRSCVGNDCRNNILDNIIRDKLLTSGYFSSLPFKPKGKCSHGDLLDTASLIEPTGGINKDDRDAKHGFLHLTAADVAMAATRELLEDIRGAAGDRNFLQMIGISNGAKALCLVIDTTGSMSDDIAEVKRVSSLIVDSSRGTQAEPSLYILVPFNDPEFGPLTRTTDPDYFKTQINSLTASGGGDFPEMSLSGLQLALTGAPPSSEIFLFTDATAKDTYLAGTVLALIERSKSVVNFLLTGSLASRRRRSSGSIDQGQTTQMRSVNTQLYRDLAQASGGQAIQVTKTQLPQATSLILQSTSSNLVTLLQAVRSPGKPDNFSFVVDVSVTNVTVYIVGSAPSFTLINPAGVSQSNLDVNGTLASVQSVGTFQTLQLDKKVGLWEIRIDSAQPYTLKVVGQSALNFLFELVEVAQGSSLAILNTRPASGSNATLVVTVTGSDSAEVTEVALVESSGTQEIKGSVQPMGGGDFLVTMGKLPAGDFLVRLSGVDSSSRIRAAPISFQRQSSTRVRTSSFTVTAVSDGVFEPGSSPVVPFTVSTNGTGGDFVIQATNNQGFRSSFPSSLFVEIGGSANGTVTLTVPADTPSGSDVTLTIEAQAPGTVDTNYAVLRLSITRQATDVTRPVCQIVSVTANCSANCSLSTWQLSANLSDGNGTGIQRITLRQGDGTLNTTSVLDPGGENVTLALYSASCCSPDVELVAVDGEGNVATCFQSIKVATADTTSQAPNTPVFPPLPMTNATTVSVSNPTSSGNTLDVSASIYLTVPLVILKLGI